MRYLLLLLLLPTTLFAQSEWDTSLFDTENAPPPSYPFAISGQYVDVSKADFRTPGLGDRDLKYTQSDVALAYTHPCNETWGWIFGAGWVGTEVDMKDNPEFNETNFNYVNLSLGVFTRSFPEWTWTVTLAAFFDVEEFSLSDYTLYQGVLWGKYDFCKNLELDFGLIFEGGLCKEKVWPILGFVYTPYKCLRLNAVYPINIALEYDITKRWILAGSVRFLRNRHRVQKEEPNPQGIFEYHTSGAEVDLIFTPIAQAMLKGFAGSTFDGDFKVSDRNDGNSTHYKFKGSFYAGASAVVSF